MWEDYAEIDRADETEARDPESGMKTTPTSYSPVWSGFGSKQAGRYQINRANEGDKRLDANGLFLLPEGEHGVQENDRITCGRFHGRVRRIDPDTVKFYTRLFIRWETTNRKV